MKNKNPKSPLTDSNSELSTKPQSQLMRQDAPHYYEVKIPNHPNGVPQMHCGNIKDAERLLEMYPDSTIEKIYLPHPPHISRSLSASLILPQCICGTPLG